jgi:hypothetical protein
MAQASGEGPFDGSDIQGGEAVVHGEGGMTKCE